MASHRFWTHWLIAVTTFFAVQSVSWIWIGSFDPFGFYDSLLAQSLLGSDSLPTEAIPTTRFMIGLLGATSAGFFVLMLLIVCIPYRRCEAWSRNSIAAGILTWFVIDSTWSLIVGAEFNVFLVNIPCLLVIGLPLWLDSTSFRRSG